jgi:hypothetical protein
MAHVETGLKLDPAYFIIPCKYGDIYPVNDTELAFHCTSAGIRGNIHRALPKIHVQNWSDDGEAIFIFDKGQFNSIAPFARPRRKKVISEQTKQLLAENRRKLALRTPQNRGQNGQGSTISKEADNGI